MLRLPLFLSLALFAVPALADLASDIAAIEHRWDIIKYQTPKDAQEQAFAALAAETDRLAASYPKQAEALVIEGVVYGSYASARGGLSALSLVEKARDALQESLQLDDQALQGSAYYVLGSIYYQVPGWPIAFGDDDKAREYLDKAVAMNPTGLDSNFWYASFLIDQRDYQHALPFLEKAKQAPPRPGREIGDTGRQKEVDELMEKVRKKLKR